MSNVIFTPASFEDETDTALWPKWTTKYYSVDKVIKLGNNIVNTIINNAPITGKRKLLLVDVRHQYLTPGFCTSGEVSKERWHYDTLSDNDALHHIYIIGKNRTEFKIDDEIVSLPPNHYATYGNDVLHRGIEVHTEEFRLLLRIEEVNEERWERDDSTGIRDFFPNIFPIGEYPVSVTEDKYDLFEVKNNG